MNPIVVEAEADEERIDAERALEVATARDRAAAADRDDAPAPLIRERRAGLLEYRRIRRHRQSRGAGMADELGRDVVGQAVADELMERGRDPDRVLIADEAEGHLGRGLAGDDGLAALPGIAAPDAVDVAGRARLDLL